MLGFPLEQKPNPHLVFNQILIEDQQMLNRLTNTGQPWHLLDYDLSTVAGTSEYDVAFATRPASDEQVGKVFYAVRQTTDPDIAFVRVPVDDYNELDYGELSTGQSASLGVTEKISVYRNGSFSQNRKVVIQPIPQEVLAYKIKFFVGTFDRLAATLGTSATVTEIVDFLDIRASLALLPHAEWEGNTRQENREQRKDIAAGLMFQLEYASDITEKYIKQMNAPQTFEIGHWDE